MIKVKICGIKRVSDALLAVEFGADAIGLLVGQTHSSSDFISPLKAREIVLALPVTVTPVLVTHLTDPDAVATLLGAIKVSAVQIHGEMIPASVRELRRSMPGLRLLKSFHVKEGGSLDYGDSYRRLVDGFVLDSINPASGQIGGTGKTNDWGVARRIVEYYSDIPVILAGGLCPANVACAIAAVRPAGVDVNSGTKGPDGFKDPVRIADFIRIARTALNAQARLPADWAQTR